MEDKAKRDLKGRFLKGVKTEWTFEKGIRKPHQAKADLGSKHWNWKGGRFKDSHGHIQVYKPEHPNCDKKGYVPEHRLVMEKHIGRYLTVDEIVHHINQNRQDNRIKNLQIMTNGEHMSHHITEYFSHLRKIRNAHNN